MSPIWALDGKESLVWSPHPPRETPHRVPSVAFNSSGRRLVLESQFRRNYPDLPGCASRRLHARLPNTLTQRRQVLPPLTWARRGARDPTVFFPLVPCFLFPL